MEEIWKPIAGYEGVYQISSLGRVMSIARSDRLGRPVRERIISISVTKNGYVLAHLWSANKEVARYVHHLVAEAFIGPRPSGMDVCHWDGDRLCNSVENLRYDSRSANERDKTRHGTSNRGSRHGLAKAKESDIPVIRHRVTINHERAADVGADYGLSARAVTHIANRTRWKHI